MARKVLKSDFIEAVDMGGDQVDFGYFLDLESNQIRFGGDDGGDDDDEMLTFGEMEEDPERFLPIKDVPSRQGFRWMSDFAEVQSGENRIQLLEVLEQRKPFRKFKETVYELGVEKAWYEFRESQLEVYALQYAEELGLELVDEL